MALFRPATGIFIKPHPGSISIWGKTIPQKDKAVVRPESKKRHAFLLHEPQCACTTNSRLSEFAKIVGSMRNRLVISVSG